ncbi:MAG: sulfatase [Cyclobacteriaceae bacterium]|nr:sulfatase [Cyclobacteriaceae bacterium]
MKTFISKQIYRKGLYLIMALTILFYGCKQLPEKTADEEKAIGRPNLVLIIADDMNWDDSGAYGHPYIKTPNLDKMAAGGMRFTHAFLTTSSCSPSRSSIITGLYPHQTGAEQLHWPLPADKTTFVEKLKEAGYWTAQAGKWHLGNAVKDRFNFLAADSLAVLQEAVNSEEEKEWLKKGDGSGCHLWVPTLKHRPNDKPFFLWLAAVDPHRGYRDSIIAEPHGPQDVVLPPYNPDTKLTRKDYAMYYDEISRMDGYIGQVMSELEKQGVADNTLILFISDNGRPFPRNKTTLYDGGIRTPWILRWPAKINSGIVSGALVSSLDIAPTFLALAGIDIPPSFEGNSFSPMLGDPATTTRKYIYAEDHWHDMDDYTRAVRDRRYKYIRNYYPELPNTPPADALKGLTYKSMLELKDRGMLNEGAMSIFKTPRDEEELYDTENDSFELNNLAGHPEYTELLERMRKQLDEFRTQTNDTLPIQRTPDEYDRLTGDPLPNRKMPRTPSKRP